MDDFILNTLLESAETDQHMQVIDLLLNKETLHEYETVGDSLLHAAIRAGQIQFVKHVIISCNSEQLRRTGNYLGELPIHLASQYGITDLLTDQVFLFVYLFVITHIKYL